MSKKFTLKEYNDTLQSLPNELRSKIKCLDLMIDNLEYDIAKMKMDGEITDNQYKAANECIDYLLKVL